VSPWSPESQSTILVSCHLGSQCLQPIIQWLACINCQACSATEMPSLASLWFALAPCSTGSLSFSLAIWHSGLGLGLCSLSYIHSPGLLCSSPSQLACPCSTRMSSPSAVLTLLTSFSPYHADLQRFVSGQGPIQSPLRASNSLYVSDVPQG